MLSDSLEYFYSNMHILVVGGRGAQLKPLAALENYCVL